MLGQINPVLQPYEYLNFVQNPDGSVTRKPTAVSAPVTPAKVDPDLSVLSKGIPINSLNNTWAQVFLPLQALDNSNSSITNKLPLIIYYHGGGFITWSAATSFNHDFCSGLASEIPPIVLSIEYRLAPEHRLPAAYDDAVEGIQWVKTTDEEWLKDHADDNDCYIMGSSAGGNIAYHAGPRVAAETDHNLKIKGLILHQPFFGGVQRSESEARLVNDQILPPVVCDIMCDLALPTGADRDHEYCNPTVGGGSKLLDLIKSHKWRVLVSGFGGDPLIDRQIELVKLMEGKGSEVVGQFVEGDYQGVEIFETSKAKAFHHVIKNFIM